MDGGVRVVWCYEEKPDNCKWIPFFLEDQPAIEDAFTRDHKKVKLETWSGREITVDFKEMVQRVQRSFVKADDNLAESVYVHKIARCADLGGTMDIVSKHEWPSLSSCCIFISVVGEDLQMKASSGSFAIGSHAEND